MSELFDKKYRFVKDLGRGGFGRVFLAKEEYSENLVAIKQLLNKNPDDQAHILHEMQAVSKFNHSNIINYKHHFIQDGLLFIVMEYCSTGSLRKLMSKDKIASAFVWKWMESITSAMQFVHDKGIVHHDIKPDNLLFTEDRILKISDFGLANKEGGTWAYMGPETFDWQNETQNDVRIDVYALGVTLLEVLTGKNPFLGKSTNEIEELHEQKNFGLETLPNWQQEIVLKAIDMIPELRFQSMTEFNEAIKAQSVPIIFDKQVIKAGEYAAKAEKYLKNKKWLKALSILDYAERELKPSVNVLQLKGEYYLLQNNINLAKQYFEKALKWNPRLDVQKQLGWIYLEQKSYPTAISLLSDHLHRSPADYEAYNLLAQCFYETGRYEQGMNLLKLLLEQDKSNQCFANNYYICSVLLNAPEVVFPQTVLKSDKTYNPFLNYNQSVVLESQPSHSFDKKPSQKSKLLFMDYRFSDFTNGTLYCPAFKDGESRDGIITFGRESFEANDIKVPGGNSISRRHCLIVNAKDDVWLYDLDSTGTSVNGVKVDRKSALIGRNNIRIGKNEYDITNDKTKLL